MVGSGCTGVLKGIINMKGGVAAILVFLTACVMVISCKDASDKKKENAISGKINISVDETFKPVIEEQIKVFESSFPEAHINATYKSEVDCFRDLQNDSTRMILVARGLNGQEAKFFKNKLSYDPRYEVLAYDAIAVIVNNSSNDTVFTMKQLSSYLKGEGTDRQVVLDGKNATSTVRYLLDSVVRGKSFGKNVTAAESSEGVINFVANNANAIGMVGISWIGDQDDPKQREYLKKIKLAFIECKRCGGDAFYKPTQASVSEGKYSLYRELYYILKDNAPGLGGEFMGFMRYERGQLIFKRAKLVPAQMRFNQRTTEISESE
jgi:phosphate transport system substrate-binding protein